MRNGIAVDEIGRRAAGRLAWLMTAATGALIGCSGADEGPSSVAEWPLTRVGVIGGDDEPGRLPIGAIADLEIGRDGSLFVLDGLNRTVRVFDQEGVELYAFGGRGQGPGEFEQPAHLVWGPHGNLWVLDLGTARLSAFEPTGQLIATYRPEQLPIVFPFALRFVASDTLRWVGAASPDLSNPSAAWVETVLSGGEIRPVSEASLPFVDWPSLFEHRSTESVFVLAVPFSGEPVFGFDGTGDLWYNHTADTLVRRWSETSRRVDATIGRGLAPRIVTSADREEALAGPDFEELHIAAGQSGVAEMTAMMPERKPFLDGFFFDDADHIWVIHAGGDSTPDATSTIDVYELGGAHVATARVALEPTPRPRVRDDLLAAVVRDELDVQSVVLYRIAR